ncbi:MAG: thioredoxin domain-containing protein [Planctomycetota bacterium]|jgi:hypothetical protein
MPEDDVRMISVGRARAGVRGLGAIFEKLAAEGRLPPASTHDGRARELGLEIVELAGPENYVPDSARDDYGEALLAEFRRHLGEDVPEAGGVPTVKILGPGCPRCEKLAASVMTALDKLGVAARGRKGRLVWQGALGGRGRFDHLEGRLRRLRRAPSRARFT